MVVNYAARKMPVCRRENQQSGLWKLVVLNLMWQSFCELSPFLCIMGSFSIAVMFIMFAQILLVLFDSV